MLKKNEGRFADEMRYIADAYNRCSTSAEYKDITNKIEEVAFKGFYELVYTVERDKVDMALLIKHLEIEGFCVDKIDGKWIHIRWDNAKKAV